MYCGDIVTVWAEEPKVRQAIVPGDAIDSKHWQCKRITVPPSVASSLTRADRTSGAGTRILAGTQSCVPQPKSYIVRVHRRVSVAVLAQHKQLGFRYRPVFDVHCPPSNHGRRPQ